MIAPALAGSAKRHRPRRAKKKALETADSSTCKSSSLFFGSITAWGPQAKKYFQSEITGSTECPWDAIGIAEHHAKGGKLDGLRRAFGHLGYVAGATEGQASSKSARGVTGGVAIAVPASRLATVRDAKAEINDGIRLYGDNWIITVLHRRGISIAYATLYLECGGYGDTNRRRTHALKGALKELGLPYVIAGDFNMTPEEAIDSGALHDLGAKIVTPDGVNETCTAGQGRMLDYWIISASAIQLILNPRTVAGCPWRPHVGIALDLKLGIAIMQGMIHIKGGRLLSLTAAKAKTNELTRVDDSHWASAACG